MWLKMSNRFESLENSEELAENNEV